MTEISQSEQLLLAAAERRLGWFILILIPLGTAVALARWGSGMALAFAVGGVLGYVNYRWLVAVVDTLVRAAVSGRVPRRAYAKVFLPLLLLAVVLYVIFSRSLLSLAGVVGGLLLLVVAVVLEAVYEIYLAVRG